MRGITSIHHLGIKAFFLRWLHQAQVKKLYQFMPGWLSMRRNQASVFMAILIWNVRGLNRPAMQLEVRQEILSVKASLVVLLE